MKDYLFIIIIMLSYMSVYSQVGINTDTPEATLDVGGNVKVTLLPATSRTTDDVIVYDASTRELQRRSVATFREAVAYSYVRSSTDASLSIDILIALFGNWKRINFANTDFDENGEFNVATPYQFVAKKAGYYKVYVQYDTTGLATVGTIGAGIFKSTAAAPTTYTLLAEDTFAQVNLLGLVAAPVRRTQTIVKLDVGDHILFGSYQTGININLLNSGGAKNFFLIEQVK